MITKRRIDKADNEKRKKEGTYISKKEYELIKAEDYMVVKDNRLIQKATFDFSELEMKCINYAISKLEPDKKYTEQDYIELSVNELCKLMGISDSGINYKHIREAFKNIGDKSKTIKFKENDFDLDFRFFLKVYGSEKGGWIRVSFMNEMLNYLQGLKNKFIAWELYYTLALKNKYSIRMYELCKSYENMKHFTFYIDKMKMKWCISDKYNYYMIKKRIIDSAIEEINNKTDIKVSILEEIKEKRKITALEISVEHNYSNTKNIYEQAQEKRNKSTQ